MNEKNMLYKIYIGEAKETADEKRNVLLLGGHVYSWGINTHYEMLLLENTRS